MDKCPKEDNFHQSHRLARAAQAVFPNDKRKLPRASFPSPAKLSTFQKFQFTDISGLDVQICNFKMFHGT